jgi:hypothetical protein
VAFRRHRDAATAWARRHGDLVTAGVVVLLALLHLLRVYNRGLNLLDEGFVLHVAERVLQGQVPYRDFFTQLTPGAFVALAGVFAVTGPSVMAGRWLTVLLGLVMTLMTYVGARRIASRPTAACASLAFPVWGIAQGWFYPNYSWFALAAGLGALLCLLRAFSPAAFANTERGESAAPGAAAPRLPHLAWPLAAGLLCGVSAFCKQNMGLYALAGLAAAVAIAGPGGWRGRLAAIAALCLGALPIPLAFVLWLARNGALAAFYRDAVWIPLSVFPRDMRAPYPPFWPPWPLPSDPPGQGAWAFRLVCLLPPLPYALTVLKLVSSAVLHRRAPGLSLRAARVAWLAFGLGIWLTAFPRADFDHVQVALGPAFVLAAAVLESIGRVAVRRRIWRLWGAPDVPDAAALAPLVPAGVLGFRAVTALELVRRLLRAADGERCRRWLPPLVACTVLGCFLFAGLGHARALHMGPGWTLRTVEGVAPRAGGILLDHDDAAELKQLVAEVRRLSAPGDAIASLPWNAGLYFLAERRNATRFDLLLPASVLPDDLPEIERTMDGARLVVYWTARDPFIQNTSLEDRLPALHAHIMSHYRAVAAVNAYRLLVRD